ncbi:MAG: hypothetical protein ABIM19_09330, partial [candidate division WOR-3 bacterium]
QVAISDRLPNPYQDIVDTHQLIYDTGNTSIFGDTVLLSMEGRTGQGYNEARINNGYAAYVYINPAGISESLEVHFYCDMRGNRYYHWHPGTYFRLVGSYGDFDIVTDTILLRKRLWMEVDSLPGRSLSSNTIHHANLVLNGYAADPSLTPAYHPTYSFIDRDTPYVVRSDELPYNYDSLNLIGFDFLWENYRDYKDDTLQYPFWVIVADTFDWKTAGLPESTRTRLGLVMNPYTYNRRKLLVLFMKRIQEHCDTNRVDWDVGKGAVFAHELGHYMAHIKHEDLHDYGCIMTQTGVVDLSTTNFCSQCLIRIQVQMPRGSEVFRSGAFQKNQEVAR